MTNVYLEENYILISFHVTSLFFNVPVEKSLEIIKHKDFLLETRTNLAMSAIKDLLEFRLKTTYFQHENDMYKQNCGLPILKSFTF